MSRSAHAAFAALMGMLITAPAHALDQTAWSDGVASIGIVSATTAVNVTVKNISNSPYPDQRELYNVSPPPAYALSGQVFCKAILGGSTRLVSAQLLFGTPVLTTSDAGTTIWPIGVWDQSDPIAYGGSISSANVQFDHAIDLPGTWNGGLYLGFNPVKVVEDHLAAYVDNGGSAADFLRQDDVFEVQIAVNLAGECENTSSYGVRRYAGYTRRWITARVFYQGDPGIYDGPAATLPDTITQSPSLPPQLFIRSPFRRATDRDPGSVTFARFSTYDTRSGTYDGVWSGWVTYPEGECSEPPRTAVTPTGECVLVQACMPAELQSCRVLEGCCDAPLSGTSSR